MNSYERLWRSIAGASGLVLAVALLVLAWTISETVSDDPVAVLDASEPQLLVEQDRDGDGFPIVEWGTTFTAEAVICNVSDRPVSLTGSMQLEFEIPSAIDPIVIFEGGSDRLIPGCTHWRVNPATDCPRVADECRPAFRNALHVDTEVAATIQRLLDQGVTPVVQLVGFMSPDEPGTLTERWFTEQFRIVP